MPIALLDERRRRAEEYEAQETGRKQAGCPVANDSRLCCVAPINGGSMDRFIKLLFLCALAVGVVALIGFWPGKYQYYNTAYGILVRVNRYSGKSEHYLPTTGWTTGMPAAASGQPDVFGRPIPAQTSTQRDFFDNPLPSPTKGQ
jgi:hypothetical protein